MIDHNTIGATMVRLYTILPPCVLILSLNRIAAHSIARTMPIPIILRPGRSWRRYPCRRILRRYPSPSLKIHWIGEPISCNHILLLVFRFVNNSRHVAQHISNRSFYIPPLSAICLKSLSTRSQFRMSKKAIAWVGANGFINTEKRHRHKVSPPKSNPVLSPISKSDHFRSR